MALKSKTVYICSSCGYETAKWAGKCPDCGEWNTMEESVKAPAAASRFSAAARPAVPLLTRPQTIQEIDSDDEHRYHTGLSELDRVLGGGLVKGSLVLISGDPGIGKSTILLQICEYLGQNLRILYVSGEESARQIKLRAVSHIEARVSEAFRLGFTRCVLPYHSVKNMDRKRFDGMELIGVRCINLCGQVTTI